MRVFVVVVAVLVAGCSTVGRIKTKTASVIGVPDAGKPASLAENHETATLPLPAGSRLVVTRIEPTAAIPATETSAAQPAQPAREVTEVVLPAASEWKRVETRVVADAGTTDTSIAKHRIDVASAKPLLFAAMGAAFAAGVFMYLKYPTPALMCGGAAVVFFLAWKLSDLPTWFYVVGVACAAGAVALWKGHDRGEKEGVRAAIAGEVEPPNPPQPKT